MCSRQSELLRRGVELRPGGSPSSRLLPVPMRVHFEAAHLLFSRAVSTPKSVDATVFQGNPLLPELVGNQSAQKNIVRKHLTIAGEVEP